MDRRNNGQTNKQQNTALHPWVLIITWGLVQYPRRKDSSLPSYKITDLVINQLIQNFRQIEELPFVSISTGLVFLLRNKIKFE